MSIVLLVLFCGYAMLTESVSGKICKKKKEEKTSNNDDTSEKCTSTFVPCHRDVTNSMNCSFQFPSAVVNCTLYSVHCTTVK